MASTAKPPAKPPARQPTGSRLAPPRGTRTREHGVLSPELARFFDAMASHFPGHVMQRLMRPDGTIRYTYVSPGLMALGLDPETILGAETSPQDWIHPDDAGRWRTALVSSAQSLTTLDEELRVIVGDGRVRWIRSIGNPRRLNNGDVVWDGIALDVTDKREALDAMRLAKADAERAEAQKARLLASLLAILEAPAQSLRSALLSGGQDEMRILELVATATSAMERSLALLTGTAPPMAQTTELPVDPRVVNLTNRQRDVLSLVGQGHSNRQIADRLGLSEGTVKLHVAAMLKTLGVQNRTQAATVAHQTGLSASS